MKRLIMESLRHTKHEAAESKEEEHEEHESRGKERKEKVCMPKKEFKKEHHRLLKILRKGKGSKAELRKQKQEMNERE